MSEIIKLHEHHESHETNEQFIDNKPEHHEHAKKHEHHLKKVEELKQDVEKQHPLKSSELLSTLNEVEEAKPLHPPNKELQLMALNNYLSNIRLNLSLPSKMLSKFIHKDKVNTISEVTGKTVFRPTAILFAGFFMFVGSAIYLYATYNTDARYNFFIALFLFFGGFAAGIVVELFYKIILRKDF
jgi:hypothetical protein